MKQVLVFADEGLKQPVTDMVLPPNSLVLPHHLF